MTKFSVNFINENKKLNIPDGTKIRDFIKDNKKKYYAALVNGRLRELNYKVVSNCDIELIGKENSNVSRMYEAGLRYLFALAFYNLFPKCLITFHYNVSRSILAIPRGFSKKFNEKDLKRLTNEVDRIIKEDLPLERKLIPISEIKAIYERQNHHSKSDLLNFRLEEYSNVYKCGNYYNYTYSLMVPSTGYLNDYKAFINGAGFIIQYPRSEVGGVIPPFVEDKKFANALRNASNWNKITKISTIADMNRASINDKAIKDFINICEIRHTNDLYLVSKEITKRKDKVKLIAIAGPSSSGKTTFSERLRLTLKCLGRNLIRISMDDYYLPHNKIPKEKDGSINLEAISALDTKRFAKDIKDLISGKEVTLPKFDFQTASVENGRTLKIAKDDMIIIEGIHALNDELTRGIPRDKKYNIYISPQMQLNIDMHDPISITDLRLLRRIVRDSVFRSASPEMTISMWPSVRKGEFEWIYPFQENADFVFSSDLAYEFMVLKKHAIANLQAMPRDSEYFIDANRLLKFLKYFNDIPDELVPANSLLREFIGGSNI